MIAFGPGQAGRLPRATSVIIPALVIGALSAAHVRGDFQPPEIIFNQENSARSVEAEVEWFDPVQGKILNDSDANEFHGRGPWQEQASAVGQAVSATASQDNDVAKFSIYGDASAGTSTTGGQFERASALSTLEIFFSVPVEAPFTFSASFDYAEIEPFDSQTYIGQVGITGLAPFDDCLGFFSALPEDENTWEVVCNGIAPANTQIGLFVAVRAIHPENTAGETHASVEFTLDFGDRDHDGLLDTWEEEGISVDGGGFIDLPGMGANPDKKDVFVELDVMQGVLYDAVAIERVTEAFANAPASLVDNHDGSQGMQLHVIVDGDRPEMEDLSVVGTFSPEFQQIKNSYFGSEDERAHPNWAAIWDARLHVFRYGLWASRILLPGDCAGELWGIAEGIPSNDFMVAASSLFDFSFRPTVEWTADDLTNAYAGVFMHELGHTLGLRHGGGSENQPQFKPNHLSIMNYAYSVPWAKQTEQGTHAREAFVLDYSRQALSSLDEFQLVESAGLDGPQGRKMLFNSAPNDFPKSRLTLGWASASAVNWNHDFDQNSQPIIEMEPLSPSIDLSRFAFNQSPMCGGVEIPSSLDLLKSYSDWDRLHLGLAGITQVPDSALLPWAAPSERGLDLDTVLAILDAEWVDQTVTGVGDLIFSDGFESGGE